MTQAENLRPVVVSWTGYPMVHADTFHTEKGTPYLWQPGVVLTSAPRTDITGLRQFLEGFGPELNFGQYLDDPTSLSEGTLLVKAAGQVCYASFGVRRTMNVDAGRYINNILESGHGSVIEHANYSFFVYGISRSLTHEAVRHRAGFAFSQLSQRYVSGRVLRFVERPEYVDEPDLHSEFLKDIDNASERYESTAQALYDRQAEGLGILSGDARTDLRKKVQQAARSKLPNETETFMMMTGNARAWRHFINMRANPHAETEIRSLAVEIFRCLRIVDPLLFDDCELVQHSDGTYVVNMTYPKV